MKKILITYATAGVGHKKAALAIRDALAQKKTDCVIETIDVLDHTNAFFKYSYPTSYLLLINKLIFLWGILYYFFDNRFVHAIAYWPRCLSHITNSIPLIRYVRDFKPDVVISTHFLMPDVCWFLKKRYGMKMQVINVVTDYRAHAFWVSGGVDTYMVAYDRTKRDLVEKWGIPDRAVMVTGIPVEPKFSMAHDRVYFRKRMDIPRDEFVILLLSGGYGVGPLFEALCALNGIGVPLTVMVVCGHNEVLHAKIEAFKKQTAKITVKNFGYVNTVDELMAVADLYIGKAGGISTTEAVVMGLPPVFVRPIPGQESRNADLIRAGHAGVTIRKIAEIGPVVKDLCAHKEKMDVMRKNIESLRKPKASSDIADYALRVEA
ncbi:MAG: glycosyltransferase [Candidatus Omnitrophica bacterium]|nr:glycosyltransferase [Candidatus Omnitrophota bacterium]